jgi:hypothetical protein
MDTESDADEAAFIRLRRANVNWDSVMFEPRKYRVLIDDEEFGSLARGETKTFPVAPGEHKLKLECGNRNSSEKVLHLDGGDVADFICSPGWSAPEGRWRSRNNLGAGYHYIALEGPTLGSSPGLL